MTKLSGWLRHYNVHTTMAENVRDAEYSSDYSLRGPDTSCQRNSLKF